MEIELVGKIYEIFHKKGWSDPENSESSQMFDKFCRIIEKLTPDEIELMMNITELYLVKRLKDYDNLLRSAIYSIDKNIINNSNTIYIIPIISPEDKAKRISKSSNVMIYPTKHILTEVDKRFKGKSVECLDTLQYITSRQKNGKTLFIYLDAFLLELEINLNLFSKTEENI